MDRISNKVRFAVVGCGHIGKRHAEMITRDSGAELIALCDIKPKESLGIEAYNADFYSSFDSLVNAFEYYNCDSERGTYSAFYVEVM